MSAKFPSKRFPCCPPWSRGESDHGDNCPQAIAFGAFRKTATAERSQEADVVEAIAAWLDMQADAVLTMNVGQSASAKYISLRDAARGVRSRVWRNEKP